MARKKRRVRPRDPKAPKGFDSLWEYNLYEETLKSWKHHAECVEYIIEKKYEPDFVKEIDGKTILLEAKGRFWDYPEYSKYIWIKKVLPINYELVFIFKNPYAPMPQAKKRKDGTKRSHKEWAEANDFRWFSEETIPNEWKN